MVPEEQTKDKTLEKTKFLDKNIQDIFLVDQNGKKDLIFNLPTIDEGVNYYLKDVKVADDDFSKIENRNINLKMMHGVNKIAMIIFLVGMIYFIIKKVFFQ